MCSRLALLSALPSPALPSELIQCLCCPLQGQKSFEVRWHPFFLNPDAPKEGVNKMEMYCQKFGEQRVQQMVPMMTVCPLLLLMSLPSPHFKTCFQVPTA